MLSTALAIQQATQEAVMDDSTMSIASFIFHKRNELTDDEFAQAMFKYSAHLSAVCATLVTTSILTETQLDEMMDSVKEMELLGKEITNGNN